MPLESLLELVETLHERIDKHGAALRQSEALTRYALIDPLLRELGWDTEDPALVMPEYRLGRGYADYALLKDGKPMIMVEAKKLGTPLQDAASQGIGYCIEDGIAYFAVTDGRQWEIYETHKMARIAEKLTVQFDLTVSATETCLRALALWRSSAVRGGLISAPQNIVHANVREHNSNEQYPSTPILPADEPGAVWTPLTEFRPESGDPSTVEILFPDSSTVQLEQWQWYRVTTETVRWLYESGRFSIDDCRVQRGSRYVVSDYPSHPNGNDFTAQKEIGPFFIESNYSSIYLVMNAQLIIEHAGLDPSRFKMRVSS